MASVLHSSALVRQSRISGYLPLPNWEPVSSRPAGHPPPDGTIVCRFSHFDKGRARMPDDAPVPPPTLGISRLLPHWWTANPWVGLITGICTIVSVPLAIYFYLAGQSTRALTVTSDPAVTVVRAGQTSSVDILYH